MKKKTKNIAIVLSSMLLALSLTGCSDMLDEDYDYESVDEEYYDDSADSESTYDENAYASSFDNYNLLDDSQFPLGSCGRLEGKIVLVSIFMDDATSSWDLQNSEQDLQIYSNMATQTRIGCDWIEEQATAYGKNVEIISDFESDNELFYQGSTNVNMDDNEYHLDAIKGFIGDSIDGLGEHLLEKYDADNICYAFYFNKPESSTMSSCAYEYLGPDYDLPYECVIYGAHVNGVEQGPAMYAHEILHCFGAPDLYMANTSIEPITISQEFCDYCTQNHITDIMHSCYDVLNNTVNHEMVTNDLSEITAYYLGWVDSSEECEQFGAADREEK